MARSGRLQPFRSPAGRPGQRTSGGGPRSAALDFGWLIAAGAADLFLTYCIPLDRANFA
jgi:hypothetical protein